MHQSLVKKPEALASTGCCAPFDPAGWDDQELVWRDKLFVKDHVVSLFHIPLDMGTKVMRAQARIAAASAAPRQPLMLAGESTPWGCDLFIEVTRPVPDAEMATLSGTFLTKVFDGPFRDEPRWAVAMKRHVAARGRRLCQLYSGYTTCPACAKAYGHNYVVLFAEVTVP